MTRFEYKQNDYYRYPTVYELNKEGVNGWEIVDIIYFKDEVFDDDECEYVYVDKIKIIFKRKIDEY